MSSESGLSLPISPGQWLSQYLTFLKIPHTPPQPATYSNFKPMNFKYGLLVFKEGEGEVQVGTVLLRHSILTKSVLSPIGHGHLGIIML